jgi:hypothetical protein
MASTPFALVSVEGTREGPTDHAAQQVGFRLVDAGTIPASAIGDVYTDERPGPGLRPDGPAAACTDGGQCLTVWANAHYHECTWFELLRYIASSASDCFLCGASEYYVEVNGDRIWREGGFSQPDYAFFWSDTRTINETVSFCNSASISMWEEDDGRSSCWWYNCDDHMGTVTIDYYTACPASNYSDWFGGSPVYFDTALGEMVCAWEFDNGGDTGYLRWYLHENEWQGIYGAILDSGGVKQVSQFDISDQGPEGTSRGYPAVASDGTDFLVVWQ